MENLFDLYNQTSGVCTDTRKIVKDCLFICLSGDNFNGNTFAQKAIDLGATNYMLKPFSVNNLQNKIEELINKYSQYE